MGLPDSPDASLDQVLQISTVLSSLEAARAAYNGDNESEDGAYETGWTAVNRPTLNPFAGLTPLNDAGSEEISDADRVEEREFVVDDTHDAGQRDICLKVEDDQGIAHHIPTGIYMMNAQAGSWSGRLSDDEGFEELEIQAFLAQNHLRRAQQMANAQIRAAERLTTGAYLVADIPTHGLDNTDSDGSKEDYAEIGRRARKKASRLRNDIMLINITLQDRGELSLEHTGAHDVDYNMFCKYAYCTSDDQCIPAHSYYITLALPAGSMYTCRYCFPCFEAIWNGDLLVGAPPDPRVLKTTSNGEVQESNDCACHGATQDTARPNNAGYMGIGTISTSSHVYKSMLMTSTEARSVTYSTAPQRSFQNERRDSAQPSASYGPGIEAPASLLTSKHAPKLDEFAVSQLGDQAAIPIRQYKPPSVSTSALRSTLQATKPSLIIPNNFGRFAPTRFQHLAHLISPGRGLNGVEKAALDIWKATTKEQFRCLARGPFSAPISTAKTKLVGEDGLDLDMVRGNMGLSNVRFFGRDLSEVFVQVDARKDL